MSSQQLFFASKRTVLVTAGASGIGRAIAEAFVRSGNNVHICDVSEDNIASFLQDVPEATASHCDISAPDQVDGLFADLARHHGTLDVLVNNAGVAGPTAKVEDVSVTDWNTTINVDLNGTFYVTRLAVPLLKKQESGSIINIASSAVFSGYPLRSPYSAAKWAIVGLTKTWAMELGPYGIRVNGLCPGSVDGPRIEAVIERDARERGVSVREIRDIYQRQSSMRKFVSAEDVANMALFLASDNGASVSGQIIGIDGHTESLSNWSS